MLTRSEIKYIQSLTDNKWAVAEGVYAVEGKKIFFEYAKEVPERIIRIYALDTWVEQQKEWPVQANVIPVTEEEMKKISFLNTPGEVLALVSMRREPQEQLQKKGITVVLDQLQDPGNLGTIIRTCDWFGASQVICVPGTVSPYNQKVIQSAMGSDIRVPVITMEPEHFFGSVGERAVYAAVLDGQSLYGVQPREDAILVIGNESRGISEKVLHYCSDRITIPRFGRAESLNAGIAAAVVLSHFRSTFI